MTPTKMGSRRKFIRSTATALGVVSVAPISGWAAQPSQRPNPYNSEQDVFSMIREQLLIPKERIYLNTGSLGPSPRAVVDEVMAKMWQLEANPVVENWGPLGKQMEEVRAKVGAFINAPADDVILTRNTTEGLILIGQGLKLNSGDEIITTTHEHRGGEVWLEHLAKVHGAVIKKVEIPMPATSVEEVVKAVEKAITDKTKVVLLSHINTITGLRMPFSEIAKFTKPNGILLIADGAQAPGMINVDVSNLGVDAYAASGHKWLMGPKETGFVYLSKALQEQINPIFLSAGNRTYTESTGTRNVATIIGLGKAIEWQKEIGVEKIEGQCLLLRAYLLEKLQALTGLKIISPSEESLFNGIVSVDLTNSKKGDVAQSLKTKNIIVKVLPKYNALRFSCHMFVSKPDIDKLITELTPLL